MNFQFYLEKLFASENFQNFLKEYPDTYPCSGFFTLDLEKNNHQQHFDYFVPSINKIFSFKIEDNCEKIETEFKQENKLDKLSMNYTFNLNRIKELIEKRIEEENMKTKIQKILLSLQKIKNDDFLTGTIFISNLGMIKIKITLPDEKIIEFEKKSFLDMFKIIKKQ